MPKLSQMAKFGVGVLVFVALLNAQVPVELPPADKWKEFLGVAADVTAQAQTASMKEALLPSLINAPLSYPRDMVVPLLLSELSANEERRRLNASGLLAVMSMLRTDAAMILESHTAALGQKLRTGNDRPTYNCLMALAKMKPSISVGAATVLSDWLAKSLHDRSAAESIVVAALGMARCNGCREAPELVVEVLDQLRGTEHGIKLIRAIGEARIPQPVIFGWIIENAKRGPHNVLLLCGRRLKWEERTIWRSQ